MTLTLERPSRTERLYEEAFSNPNVDFKNGIIRRAKILGRTSKNGGRVYSDNAMRQAAKEYEGMRLNFDHDRANPNAERRIDERAGVIRNVVVTNDGVFGDLHILKSHPRGPQVLEMADKMSDTFGLSHNADGRVSRRSGSPVVEEIERVRSVDIVGIPATTVGLFESVRELFIEEDHSSLSVAPLPVAGGKNDSASDVLDGIHAEAMRVIDDGGLSDAEKIKQLRVLLKLRKRAQKLGREIDGIKRTSDADKSAFESMRESAENRAIGCGGNNGSSIRFALRRYEEKSDFEKFKSRFGSRR